MPDSVFYTLLASLSSTITTAVAGSATVAIGRTELLEDTTFPFVGIYLLDDVTIGELGALNLSFLDWEVRIGIEIYIKGQESYNREREYLNLRNTIHAALMADHTQGLSFVTTTVPVGAEQGILDGTSKSTIGSWRTAWMFKVRTGIADMTGV